MTWLLRLLGAQSGGSGLMSAAMPYVIGILGVAVIGAGVTTCVQTARLEAAQEEAKRVQAERDTAVAVNKDLAAREKRAADAEREHRLTLEKLRGQYEDAERKIRAIEDDGCLSRPVPADALGVFRKADDRGAGTPPDPGVPRAAPGS